MKVHGLQQYRKLQEDLVRGRVEKVEGTNYIGEYVYDMYKEILTELGFQGCTELFGYYLKYFPSNLMERLDLLSSLGIDKTVLLGEIRVNPQELHITYSKIVMVTTGIYVDEFFKLNEKGKQSLRGLLGYTGANGNIIVRVEAKGLRIRTETTIETSDIKEIYEEVLIKLLPIIYIYKKVQAEFG